VFDVNFSVFIERLDGVIERKDALGRIDKNKPLNDCQFCFFSKYRTYSIERLVYSRLFSFQKKDFVNFLLWFQDFPLPESRSGFAHTQKNTLILNETKS